VRRSPRAPLASAASAVAAATTASSTPAATSSATPAPSARAATSASIVPAILCRLSRESASNTCARVCVSALQAWPWCTRAAARMHLPAVSHACAPADAAASPHALCVRQLGRAVRARACNVRLRGRGDPMHACADTAPQCHLGG
jgi:hypothetical protein